MKKFILILSFILCFLVGGCFGLGAFADNAISMEGIESADSTVLEVSASDGSRLFACSDLLPADRNSYSPEDSALGTLTGVRLMSVAPVAPADDGSLKSTLLGLIGSYDPVVLEYEYTNGNGYTSYLREVQLDYPWIAAAVLFIVVLWCVFKIGGRVLWNK